MFGDTFIETSGRKKEDFHMGWGHVLGTLIFVRSRLMHWLAL